MLPQEIEAEVGSPEAVNSGAALAEGFWAAALGGLCHMQMPEMRSPACRGYLASVAPAERLTYNDTEHFIFMHHWLKMRPFMQCTYCSC